MAGRAGDADPAAGGPPPPGEPAEPRGRSKPTITDVAERAGVSKGTVSKYLNVRSGYAVSAASRAKIEDAIRELNYRPSAIARSLTRGATLNIGLVIADIKNPFFPDLVASVQEVLAERGYKVLLGSSGRDTGREVDIIHSMTEHRVDGLMLASVQGGVEELRFLERMAVPCVLASRDLPELIWDTVVVDNVRGARLAAKHLRDLGHTRIGYVGSDPNAKPFADRLHGFQSSTADLPHAPVVIEGGMMEDGRRGTHELLSQSPRPTAVHYANDQMALGGLVACEELALRVPWDVSIVGYDNISAGSLPGIGLTTVDSAAATVGAKATEMLLERIAGLRLDEQPPRLRHEPTRLILRSSTAPAPDGS
ncbi:MAG TPA: LacI family transcriptional regulator [Candidatus Ruania gallistercoris]|uniref:LacI family transcriptional regulator n=1 Tax=Candidatus Ruania gallistercoris TaxID=2838746 RepID=A0A9D2EFE9_9MICO|nr:LacI family transcriptional regulator [Candidatus Ruania gallistercoris]